MPLYHNQVCTSFLGYKVTQILYNKLTQARPPTTTAKPSNSQMFHIKNTLLLFFFHFLATISHITREKKEGKKGRNQRENFWVATIFGFLRTINAPCPHRQDCLYELQRLTYCVTVYSNHINIYEQKYTKLFVIQKGLMPNGSLRL